MKVFEEEIKKRNKINKLSVQELENLFNNLDNTIKINILIKWFGIRPLTKEMLNKNIGIDYLKEELIKNE